MSPGTATEVHPPRVRRPRYRPAHVRHNDTFAPVLTIRARVERDRETQFTREALREIRSYIKEQGLEVDGAPFATSHPLPDHCVDVEAGWPVRKPRGNRHIQAGALPVTRLRSQRQYSETATGSNRA